VTEAGDEMAAFCETLNHELFMPRFSLISGVLLLLA
jgi:hypothetical protein